MCVHEYVCVMYMRVRGQLIDIVSLSLSTMLVSPRDQVPVISSWYQKLLPAKAS